MLFIRPSSKKKWNRWHFKLYPTCRVFCHLDFCFQTFVFKPVVGGFDSLTPPFWRFYLSLTSPFKKTTWKLTVSSQLDTFLKRLNFHTLSCFFHLVLTWREKKRLDFVHWKLVIKSLQKVRSRASLYSTWRYLNELACLDVFVEHYSLENRPLIGMSFNWISSSCSRQNFPGGRGGQYLRHYIRPFYIEKTGSRYTFIFAAVSEEWMCRWRIRSYTHTRT